jgi:predicted phosphoserine aminotransferase
MVNWDEVDLYSLRLFTPGPVAVREDLRNYMGRPMITHRMQPYYDLQARIVEKLKKLMYTQGTIIPSTSSSTGLMEAAIRNCVEKRCLNLVCGAFSKRWHDITKENGKECDTLEVDFGKATTAEMVEEAMDSRDYDAVTLVHNETSTGVMNPMPEIAKVVKDHDAMLLADCVSSMGAVKIEVDKLGIDVCLFGVQKAMALPPGLAIASVSDEAMKKSEKIQNKGYYFNFQVFKKYLEKNQTPATPVIPILWGLEKQLDYILDDEGLENRYNRHTKMAELAREWAKNNFDIFAEHPYESQTVTAVANTKGIDVEIMRDQLFLKGFMIVNGYGSLKHKTFRIAHMGDVTVKDLKELLATMDEVLSNL